MLVNRTSSGYNQNDIAPPHSHLKRTFSRANPLTDQTLLELSPELEELIASGSAWQITDAGKFSHRIKHLKTLDVRTSNLLSKDLKKIVKANGLIENLLASCTNINASSLNSLSTATIERLNVRHCYDLHPSDIISFLEKAVNLKELYLSNSLVTAEVAEAIANHCSSLEVLEFSEVKDVPEKWYIEIAKKCPLLREICVYSSDTFTDQAFIEFLDNCKDLTKADISDTGVTDVSLKKIQNLDRKMEKLVIDGCPITYKGLEALLKTSKKSLEILKADLNERMVELLCATRPPLSSLNFSQVKWFGSKPYSPVLLETTKHFPDLKEICIATVGDVDVKVLSQLLKNCPKIELIRAELAQIRDFSKNYTFAEQDKCADYKYGEHYKLDEEKFRRDFFKERGINICRLAY